MTAQVPGDPGEEEAPQGGMVRVRQLLQSVQKSVNKTLAKSRGKAAAHQHHTETPHDVQELLNRFSRGQKALLQIPERKQEYTEGMENAVAAKESFDALLRELGETRSTYQLAEATTAVADTLLKVQDVQSRGEQAVVEFLFAMGRQERKYTATVTEHVNQLDKVRAALDKVVTKQRTAAETGGPGVDPEKLARRKQKVVARRMAFEDQVSFLRETIPRVELQADAAYCQALIEMLRQQRTSISEQALMLAELDARVEEAEALAADALSSLKGKEDEEERKRELIVAQACGPQIVEMLSAPDFAAALSIAELCASPAGEVEEGEDLLKCLLRLLDDSDLCVPLLKFAISNELPRNPPEAAAVSLFRTPSLAGALCSAALQVSGSAYLKASLAPLVQQIASGEADFEIDPRFLSDEDDAGVNADNLCKAVQWFVDTIVHSCRDAPPLVRALCTHIFNIAGPGQRPLARRVAGSLFVDAFICQALRDTGGCGVADAALDDKAQRVLEHVARSLSRAVDDTTSDVTSPSVFAAAAMSDFALDLPDPPPELLAVIRGNRDRLVGEGGVIDQLAGVTEFEDSSTSAADLYLAGAPAPAEEVADILALRRMLATHASTLSGMLVSQGFHAQVAQLEACLRGSSDDPAAAEADAGKLLPGSNQPAPVEHNTWTETWKGPQEDVWVEGDEEADVGMLDGEHILGEVISTPEKAAGLGAITGERGSLAQRLGIAAHADGRRAAARRKTYADGQVEAADSMPDSAPERSPASVLAAEAGRTGDRQRAHASAARLDFAAEQAAAATTQDGGGDEDGEGEGDTRLLKPRRRFTKTAAVGAGRPAGPEDASGSAEADSSPAVGMLQGAGVSLGAAGALAEEGAGESPGVLGTSAVEPEIWAGLVAGGEWSLAPSQGGKQPVLRRTQRTVTIRGRAEENEGDEEGGDSREVEHVPKPSTRTVAAQKARVGEQQECSRPGEEGRGGGEDAAGAAGAPSAEPASAAPGGVGRLYGVGAVFKRNADGFFYVKKVVSGGPADKAGVTVGSRVVSMDGERLYNRTADQLFKIVLGSEGTTLKLGLQPSGAGVRTPEQVVSVRRAFIDENFLNATAIEPLPKPAAAGGGNGASGTLGRGAWAQQQHAAATAPALAAAGGSGGEAVGIGVTFKKDGEGYYVVKKMSELGGAFASGLAVGDRVLAIDGHSMHRKSSQELSRCVLGPEGTRVTLSVRSVDGTVRDIEVKRVVEFAEPDALEGDRPQPADATALRGSGTWAAGNELDVDWEGGGTGAQGEQWDGQGEVMRLAGEPEQGIVGIGATLVRDSRGLFVVAEVAPALPGTPQGRSYSLFVGDIIVQVDGIQATGKPVEAVEGLILGPEGSPIELVMAQGVGGGTRTVRTVRRPTQPALAPPPEDEPSELVAPGVQRAAAAGAEREGLPGARHIVPLAPPQRAAGARPSSAAEHTQVGLVVEYQQGDSSDVADTVFGNITSGLRVTGILQQLSLGRHHQVEIGDVILQVDGVSIPQAATDRVLYGPPGSVVTLTVKKARPDGRVLEVMLTRASKASPGQVPQSTPTEESSDEAYDVKHGRKEEELEGDRADDVDDAEGERDGESDRVSAGDSKSVGDGEES